MSNYPASDAFVVWLQSISGMLTKMKAEYGSMPEMLECPGWDEGRTAHVAALVKALHGHIRRIDMEIAQHVKGKLG